MADGGHHRFDAAQAQWLAQYRKAKEKEDESKRSNRYEKLKAYKEKHGNTLVPQRYSADTSLGWWVQNQRAHIKKRTLRGDRKSLLDSIEFVWEQKDTTPWLGQYAKLVAYKEKHGHTWIPRNYSEDKSLGRWVNRQRALNNKGRLLNERKFLLNNIGFAWSAQRFMGAATDGIMDDKKWMNQYEKLATCKESHGACWRRSGSFADERISFVIAPKAPALKGAAQNKGWKVEGRNSPRPAFAAIVLPKVPAPSGGAQNKAPKAQPAKFQTPRYAVTNNISWLTRFDELRQYRKERGNMWVSPFEYSRLFQWIIEQRLRRQNGTLSEDHEAMLNQIGFPWGLFEDYADSTGVSASLGNSMSVGAPPIGREDTGVELDWWEGDGKDDGDDCITIGGPAIPRDNTVSGSNNLRIDISNEKAQIGGPVIPKGSTASDNKQRIDNSNEKDRRSAATKKYLSNLGFDCLVPAYVFEDGYKSRKRASG